jgi:hypothetical protein
LEEVFPFDTRYLIFGLSSIFINRFFGYLNPVFETQSAEFEVPIKKAVDRGFFGSPCCAKSQPDDFLPAHFKCSFS